MLSWIWAFLINLQLPMCTKNFHEMKKRKYVEFQNTSHNLKPSCESYIKCFLSMAAQLHQKLQVRYKKSTYVVNNKSFSILWNTLNFSRNLSETRMVLFFWTLGIIAFLTLNRLKLLFTNFAWTQTHFDLLSILQ